jgi:hypothetical protein
LFVVAVILSSATPLLTPIVSHQQSIAIAGGHPKIAVSVRENTATQKANYPYC